MTAPMTKPLSLAAEIERGPQFVPNSPGSIAGRPEYPAEFATRIALQALEEAARICERKAESLADDPDYAHVESDTNALIWTNSEAEWVAIELEEAGERIRAFAATLPNAQSPSQGNESKEGG